LWRDDPPTTLHWVVTLSSRHHHRCRRRHRRHRRRRRDRCTWRARPSWGGALTTATRRSFWGGTIKALPSRESQGPQRRWGHHCSRRCPNRRREAAASGGLGVEGRRGGEGGGGPPPRQRMWTRAVQFTTCSRRRRRRWCRPRRWGRGQRGSATSVACQTTHRRSDARRARGGGVVGRGRGSLSWRDTPQGRGRRGRKKREEEEEEEEGEEEEEEEEGGEEGVMAAGGGGAVSNARRMRRRGRSENPLGAKIDGAGATAPPQQLRLRLRLRRTTRIARWAARHTASSGRHRASMLRRRRQPLAPWRTSCDILTVKSLKSQSPRSPYQSLTGIETSLHSASVSPSISNNQICSTQHVSQILSTTSTP
jgi:hypothetical protein